MGIGGSATLEEYDAENKCALYSFDVYKHGWEEYDIRGLMLITFEIEHKYFISNKGKRKDWTELSIESTDADIEMAQGESVPTRVSFYK